MHLEGEYGSDTFIGNTGSRLQDHTDTHTCARTHTHTQSQPRRWSQQLHPEDSNPHNCIRMLQSVHKYAEFCAWKFTQKAVRNLPETFQSIILLFGYDGRHFAMYKGTHSLVNFTHCYLLECTQILSTILCLGTVLIAHLQRVLPVLSLRMAKPVHITTHCTAHSITTANFVLGNNLENNQIQPLFRATWK
jgi:hypothetical protein